MIAKQLYALCSFLLCAACSRESAERHTSNSVVALPGGKVDLADSSVADTVDIDVRESKAVLSVSDIVSRAGPELRIQLLNGRTAILKDDTTAGLRFALPRYAGYLRGIHSHVIHQYQYEGEGIYFLVDDSTADSTMVFGMPVVSPDGKRFALTSMTGLEGGNPGVIQVWRIVGRKPEKEFSYDTENESWDPSDAVWLDSVTIGFVKNTRSSPFDVYVQTPGRLKWNGRTWVLSGLEH
jgi:hypothetical protein